MAREYNTDLPVCEQNRANCNRARMQSVLADGEEITVCCCEALQDTHFNKPCPFFKDRTEQKK